MSLNLNEKIILLDRLVGKTLTITHFVEWELSSYMVDSLFSNNGSVGHVRAKSFPDCINKTFELVQKEKANG